MRPAQLKLSWWVKATAQHFFVHRSREEGLLKIGRPEAVQIIIEVRDKSSESMVEGSWHPYDAGLEDPESSFPIN
jgi:hypothetical protein